MVMQLAQVVPFGRTLDEYVQMFNLTAADLQQPILGIADGPASFNAEGTRLGYSITSVDPLYQFSADQIRQRFDAVVDNIMAQIEATPDDWVWSYHESPAGLRRNRERAIARFCEDFEAGKAEQRYVVGELPQLALGDRQFGLGLCSHFLFLYSDHFDAAFHVTSICELLRVCREVRIFPLLTLMLEVSPHLQPAIAKLEQQGYHCQIQPVAYELQRGGNQMLRITAP